MKRYFWISLGLILVAVIFMIFLRMHWAYAVLLGVSATTILALSAFDFYGGRRAAPTLPYGRNDGARQDISDLSWAFSASEELSPFAYNRLREAVMSLSSGVENLPDPLHRVVTTEKPLRWAEFTAALGALETMIDNDETWHRKDMR